VATLARDRLWQTPAYGITGPPRSPERVRPREAPWILVDSSGAVAVRPLASPLSFGSSSTLSVRGLGVSISPASLNSPMALETASRVQATMQERSWWLRRTPKILPRPCPSPNHSASSSKRHASRRSTSRSSILPTAASRSSKHPAKAPSSAGAQPASSERTRSRGPFGTFAARQAERMSRERLLPDETILEKVARYEAHLSRGLYKALHELEALQARRTGGAVPLARLDVDGLVAD
jgi:hypothetical protein